MSFLKSELELTSAPFAGLQELFGFVPNLFRMQALLPCVIEAEAGLARVVLLDHRDLSRNQKLFLLLAAASAYQDIYCVTACHGMLRRSLGVTERQLDEEMNSRQADRFMPDSALIEFALKLAANEPQIAERHIVALPERGFTDKTVLGTSLVAAFAHFLCTLSIGLAPAPDFEPRAISYRSASPSEERSYTNGISEPYLRQAEFSSEHFLPFPSLFGQCGCIPRILHAQALRPDVIVAEADLLRALLVAKNFLSHRQKECILLVGSAANRNVRWIAAQSEIPRAPDLSTEQSDQMAADQHRADLSAANKAFLDFSLKLTVRPSEFGSDDLNSLQSHKFSAGQILEAIVATALSHYFHTLQKGLDTTQYVEAKRALETQAAPLSIDPEDLSERPMDPDAALVIRVQEGDLQAFDELVTQHSRRVYQLIVVIIGNVEEAQDAMQDTFLKAFAHIGNFQRRSKFSTWLMSIANNMALQRLRNHKPLEYFRETEEFQFRFFPVRAWETDPEQLYSQAERRRLLESGLMKLPSKYRIVLILRDIEQLSTEEAATALGLGIPALKARLFRARKMLREALSPYFTVSGQKID